jgi:platelet-activating factor acetylhydrolase
MSSLLSRLNVVPQFPSYKGPYTVASLELEIPVASLPASQRSPNYAESISTVQFRVFYPTAQKFNPQTPESTPATRDSEGPKSAADGDKTKAGWTHGWFHRHGHHESQQPSKSVYWLPEPHQREYLSGYARFMGAGSGLAELISYVPAGFCHGED